MIEEDYEENTDMEFEFSGLRVSKVKDSHRKEDGTLEESEYILINTTKVENPIVNVILSILFWPIIIIFSVAAICAVATVALPGIVILAALLLGAGVLSLPFIVLISVLVYIFGKKSS